MIRVCQFLIFLIVVVASCSRPGHDVLEEADAVMERAPQEALELLKGVEMDRLSGDDVPYYGLLISQAAVKNNLDIVPLESLVEIAYSRYRDGGDRDRCRRACFYRSFLYFNKGNMREAMKDALRAYELAVEDDDDYWRAKSIEHIGDIYIEVYNYGRAEDCRREAADCYLSAGMETNHRYALCDLATALANRGQYDEALALLDSVRSVALMTVPVDSALVRYGIHPTGATLCASRQFESLRAFVDEMTRRGFISPHGSLGDGVVESFMSEADGRHAESSLLLLDAMSVAGSDRERIPVMYAAFKQALGRGDYKAASELSDTLLLLQSRIAVEVLGESVAGVQSDFYVDKASREQQTATMWSRAVIGVTIVSLVIIVLLVALYRQRMKTRRAEMESQMNMLFDLREDLARGAEERQRLAERIDRQTGELDSMQRRLEEQTARDAGQAEIVERLFRDRWSTLNMLCDDYFDMGTNEKTRGAMIKKIEGELTKLRSPRSLREVENAVNDYLGGIMTLAREELKAFKEEDFVFLSLVYAGFSARAVCLMTDITHKNFYLKRSRLKKRIEAAAPAHLELFLSKFE